MRLRCRKETARPFRQEIPAARGRICRPTRNDVAEMGAAPAPGAARPRLAVCWSARRPRAPRDGAPNPYLS